MKFQLINVCNNIEHKIYFSRVLSCRTDVAHPSLHLICGWCQIQINAAIRNLSLHNKIKNQIFCPCASKGKGQFYHHQLAIINWCTSTFSWWVGTDVSKDNEIYGLLSICPVSHCENKVQTEGLPNYDWHLCGSKSLQLFNKKERLSVFKLRLGILRWCAEFYEEPISPSLTYFHIHQSKTHK